MVRLGEREVLMGGELGPVEDRAGAEKRGVALKKIQILAAEKEICLRRNN